MYLNKIQKKAKVEKMNSWFDTKEEITEDDLPEAYFTMDDELKVVLDMWVGAYLKKSNTKYMGYPVMEKRLPIYMLQFLFFKHTEQQVSHGELKGALLAQGFLSADIDYNNNCVFNIAPSSYKALQDFTK